MSAENKTQPQALSSGRKLIGYKVEGLRGENLGRLEDLLISDEEGRVAYAVVSFGGLLGLGNKLSAVPWSALRLDDPKKRVLVDLDRNAFESMPALDKKHWPDARSRGRDTEASQPHLPLAASPSSPGLPESQLTASDCPGGTEMDHWGKNWQSHGLERR